MTYVLIAEDDADVAELLRQVLSEHLDVATQNVANGALVTAGGTCWFHGERTVSPVVPHVDILIPVGAAEPAVVPLS